jgi:hypothetical protein
MSGLCRRKRNEQKNGSVSKLPFNISDNPEFESSVINLLDYVRDGKYKTCGEVAGISRQL